MLAENDTPSFILVNAIFLLGTFTFAVVLGVVSDDIGNELKVIIFNYDNILAFLSRPLIILA